jgi:hypothetical protein
VRDQNVNLERDAPVVDSLDFVEEARGVSE